MKALLLVAALGLAEIQATTQTQTPAASGTISGVVRLADTNTPMAGGNVHLDSANVEFDIDNLNLDAKRVVSKSDEAGHFSFKEIAPGKYFIRIEGPPGFLWADHDDYNYLPGIPVTIEPGQHMDDIVFRIMPRGNVSGRILGVDGRPLAGASVEAVCVVYREGEPKLESCGERRSTTDLQGNYRLFWLVPGNYYIRTEYHPSMAYDPPKVYYPGTLEGIRATSIQIKAGSELTGIDFSLVVPPNVPNFTITGKIVGLPPAVADKPIPYIHLMPHDKATERKDLQYTNIASDITGGHFHIRGVPSGVYELWAELRDDNGLPYAARTTVTIAGSNLEAMVADVLPVVELRGRILIDGRPPEKPLGKNDGPPRVQAIDGTPAYAGFQSETKGIQFNKNTGEFTLFRVPVGRYKLNYYPPFDFPNGYIADIRQGNRSILDGFNVDTDSNQPIDVLISSSGGTIDGVAVGANSNLYAGAKVVTKSISGTWMNLNSVGFGLVLSDKEGHFSMRSLAPGQHKVYVWEKLPEGDPWRNADFMRRYELLGQTIEVSAGKTSSIRITTIPGEE